MSFPTHSALHVLLSSCGPFGAIPAAVCNLVSNASSALSQTVELIQNPFRWLYHHSLGAPVPQRPGDIGWAACQADWAQTACPKLIDQLKPVNVTLADRWPHLYGTFAVSGVFIAMTCCVVRVVRAMFDERSDGLHIVVDNIVRMVVATGLLLAPTPANSLLLNIMRLCTGASARIAEAGGGAMAAAFTNNLDIGAVVGNIAATAFGLAGIGDFLVAIPVLLAGAAFLYLLALYLLRVVQLVFAVASAPLFVAVAVYDPRSRFVQWWLDLFTSAMLLPIVLAICGSLTAGVAIFFLSGNQGGVTPGGAVEAAVRTLLACSAVLGGVWMTGKAVHGLAWRSFSHGGVTGAVTAVSTTLMALPNAAGDISTMLRRGGRDDGGGGGPEAPAQYVRGLGPPPDMPSPRSLTNVAGNAIAEAAAGHAAAAGDGEEVDAAVAAAGAVDFSRHAGVTSVLTEPAMRHAFNRAVGASLGRFAAGDEGRGVVVAATPHLDAVNPGMPARVAAYTAALAADHGLGTLIAGSSLASLLNNRPPDLGPILRQRTVEVMT